MKKCTNCGKLITEEEIKRQPRKKFCCKNCKEDYYKKSYNKLNNYNTKIPRAVRGSISEYRTSIDLLDKGYQVFKNMCPCGTIDLIAYKDGKVKLIQNKTGYMLPSGKLSYPKDESKDCTEYAVVTRNKITYLEKEYGN